MKQLYLECLSGISGDMFVAAMLDLGADETVLHKVLETVPVQGFQTRISRVKKAGLDVCDFDVILEEHLENHDHDMNYLYGTHTEAESTGATHHSHAQVEDHEHHHDHAHEDHEHHHDHTHEDHEHHHDHLHEDHEHHHDHIHEDHTNQPQEHHHHHEHRGMKEVLNIINMTHMSEHAKELAIRIFTILGKAEAKAHGTTLEEVHFHEVGAVDSIVDIIAAAVCLDNLQLQEVIIPVLYEGTGRIRCQHGILPVPVPAVANIISENHLTLHITDMEAELVTPTGAAIAAAIQTKSQLPEHFSIQRIGIGAGKRNYEAPSLLRAMIIQEETTVKQEQKSPETSQKGNHATNENTTQQVTEGDHIYKLESNIDDCTGENFGYVMERLMEAGARDVNYMPVYMKKNRPAYQLNVICSADRVSALEHIIFEETTTIGIRRVAMERSILKREVKTINTIFGDARVKVCRWNVGTQEMKKLYPEYESVTAICRKTGKAFQEIFQLVERTAYDELGK